MEVDSTETIDRFPQFCPVGSPWTLCLWGAGTGPIPVVGLQVSLQAVALERDSVTCSRASKGVCGRAENPWGLSGLFFFFFFCLFFFLALKTSCLSAKDPFPHSQLQFRKNTSGRASLKTCEARRERQHSDLLEHSFPSPFPGPKHLLASTGALTFSSRTKSLSCHIQQHRAASCLELLQFKHAISRDTHRRLAWPLCVRWKCRGLRQSQRSQPCATQDKYPRPS